MGYGSPVSKSEIGDPHGVPFLSFYNASRWHKDVPTSSLPELLEQDEETRWRFCSSMSHVSVGKGWAPEASGSTPVLGGS